VDPMQAAIIDPAPGQSSNTGILERRNPARVDMSGEHCRERKEN